MRSRNLIIVLALFAAGCASQARGVAAQCDSCTQTSDCSEGLFCGPAGQCTTMDCDQVGCSDAVGWDVMCMGTICACLPAQDMSAAPPPNLGPVDLRSLDARTD